VAFRLEAGTKAEGEILVVFDDEDAWHHDCRTQRASSASVGFLPYMSRPTL
jgi:hypothetical protein